MDPQEVNRGVQAGISTLWESSEDQGLELSSSSDFTQEADFDTSSVSTQVEELFEFAAEIDQDRLQTAMSGEEGEKIRQAVMVNGVDALGWYVPFHAYPPTTYP